MEQQIPIPSPSPPAPATPTRKKIRGWSPAKAKTCHFPILDLKRGGGVQDCSFTVLIILAVFWSSDSTSPLTHPHPIRERTTAQNRRSETTYIIYWRKKCHFAWCLPQKNNILHGLNFRLELTKRKVKCATYHELTKAANKICKEVIITRCSGPELECAFGKPVRPVLFFALLGKIMKEHLRVTLGKNVPIVFSEVAGTAALSFATTVFRSTSVIFFFVSIVLRHFMIRVLSTATVFKRETRTSVSNLHWSKTIKQT